MSEEEIFKETSQMRQSHKDVFVSDKANEFLTKMPSFFAMATLYLMVGLIVSGIIWAYFGKNDVIVEAKGILIPLGNVKEIQSPKDGIVVKLHAKEGDRVKKDDILVELDTNIRAEVYNKIIKLNEFIDLKNSEINTKDKILLKYKSELSNINEITKRELDTKKNLLSTAKGSVKRITEQHEIFNEMYKSGLISKIELLREQDKYEKAKVKIEEIKTDIETYKMKQHEKLEDINSQILAINLEVEKVKNDISDAKRNLEVLNLQYQKEKSDSNKLSYDVIKAPIDGLISESEINYEKDFIKAGSKIFSILPDNQPLVAKVDIPNTGIGRVDEGLRVKLKYEAYPYQQFGVGEGILIKIAPDSKQVGDKQEFIYEALVELDNEYILKDGAKYPLFPGLTMSAEVVVDEKKIVEYLADFFSGNKN